MTKELEKFNLQEIDFSQGQVNMKMSKLTLSFLIFPLSLLFAQATPETENLNQKVLRELPFQNKQDFKDSAKGFIAPLPNHGIIKNQEGAIVWDLSSYKFLDSERSSPNTVNPSLWRQAQLLAITGLFEVTEGIYQIRGADLSNMTIIEGKDGIIIVDTLISTETAKAALALYYDHRPKKPVKAVIYTHSHVDHFGGVKGVITQREVDEGKVKVYAPTGFTEAALSENVMAGNIMGKRAAFMYGSMLQPGPLGQMTSGLGLTTSNGTVSFIIPTDLITKTGEEKIIEGVQFVFLMAPESEAPSEMLFFLPQFNALCAAEDATHTMHNLYSLRGTKIRDAKAWASYLNETIELFGKHTEVVFAQHHWPKWGNQNVIDFLEKQRDLYKYIHDQTLRLANEGYTMQEIGELLKLPQSLSDVWYNRGYYGSLNHNAKSVYNFYLGWFDGNPATLYQLPSSESGPKFVEYMGGAEAILLKARKDFELGNYRWVAQVLNQLVFAQPKNKEAKDLLALALDQLAYQTENGPWRNFFLSGAKELRETSLKPAGPKTNSPDMIAAMPINLLLDYLAIRLNGLKAAEHPLTFNLNIPDLKEKYVLQIKNGVLNYFENRNWKNVEATVTITKNHLNLILFGKATIDQMRESKKLSIEGNQEVLNQFFSLLDQFDEHFVVQPPLPL